MSSSTKRRQARNQRADAQYYPPFVGVDGEGGDFNGQHRYTLLRCGRGPEGMIEDDNGLRMRDCLEFLCTRPRKNVIYVAFAFDYDVTMILRQASPNRINRLFDRESREYIKEGKRTGRFAPVEIGDYEVDYIPRKEFKVRRKGEDRYFIIHDVFTFFQCSFVKALKSWFPDEMQKEQALIAEGKEERNLFGAVTQHEREYNELEIVMLEALMSRFRDACYQLNIYPKKWQGPGNLISAVFQREGLPRNSAIAVPRKLLLRANDAYVGGRFEARTYGRILTKVWQYDINSAYASYYRFLPCLVHGRWERITSLPDGSSSDGDGRSLVYLADVSFQHDGTLAWNTLPVRNDTGSILFPVAGRGWYWSNELEVARKYANLTVHSGWQYIRNCDCVPFHWVYPLYDLRKEVGKDSGLGRVLKTTLATIYGKTAQAVGNPQWSNPVWAGLITSSCRAKLIEATLHNEKGVHVHMLATDGLFSTMPILELDVGPNLGQWELTEHEEMFIVQSGVYFLPTKTPKTRGIPLAKIIAHEDDFRATWSEWNQLKDLSLTVPMVDVPIRTFTSIRVARQWGRPFLAGRWLMRHKRVSFDWWTKRINPRWWGEAVVTDPVEGSADFQSIGPKRMIGGQGILECALSDAPDWADTLNGD